MLLYYFEMVKKGIKRIKNASTRRSYMNSQKATRVRKTKIEI